MVHVPASPRAMDGPTRNDAEEDCREDYALLQILVSLPAIPILVGELLTRRSAINRHKATIITPSIHLSGYSRWLQYLYTCS